MVGSEVEMNDVAHLGTGLIWRFAGGSSGLEVGQELIDGKGAKTTWRAGRGGAGRESQIGIEKRTLEVCLKQKVEAHRADRPE